MWEFYPQIKQAHLALALASGALFALRAFGVMRGMSWPHHWGVRTARYTLDTALLTAALMLLSILPGAMFSNGWLYSKLVFLFAYIALSGAALSRGRPRLARSWCLGTGLATFAMVYSIARTHHPLGVLSQVMPS